MRAKTFLPFIFLALIAIGGLWFLNRPEPGGTVTAAPLLPPFAANAVTCIAIEGAGGPVATLAKSTAGWQVIERDNYPADPQAITAFLLGIAKVRPLQNVAASPTQLGRLGLALPHDGSPQAETGTLLRLEIGHRENRVLIGKPVSGEANDPGWLPRYARVPGSPQAVIVNAAPNLQLATPGSWLDPAFPRLTTLRSCELRKDGGQVWRLSRDEKGQPWQLADSAAGEVVAIEAVHALQRAWAKLGFQDVRKSAVLPPGSPRFQLRATGEAGQIVTLELAPATGGGWNAIVTVTPDASADAAQRQRINELATALHGWLYLLPQDALAPLLIPRKLLLAP